MTTRTTTKTVTFHRPFNLKGVDRLLPPANYRVLTDEDLIEGLSVPAYRRASTVIFGPAESGCAVEMVTIDPSDLQAVIDRNAREGIDGSVPPVAEQRAMTAKNQKPNLRPKIWSAGFLIWVVSGFYLLAMIWLLLAATGTYGTHEPWLASAAAVVTVVYGILMLLLWRNEEDASANQADRRSANTEVGRRRVV